MFRPVISRLATTVQRRQLPLVSGSRAASTLVLGEHNGKEVSAATLSAVTAAAQLGDVSLLLCGKNAADAVAHAGTVSGVGKVLYADTEAEGYIPETITPIILASQEQFKFSHLMAPATSVGKNVLPRVSAKLDVGMVSEITEVVSEDTFVRLVYAGNAVCKVKSNDDVKVITVRPTNFEPAAVNGNSAETVSVEGSSQDNVKFVGQEVSKSDRPSLSSAKRVVSGGRGLGSAESFDMLNTLADKLGAAVGASRAAVDAGYVPNEYQVGQTGKIVAPELYIAIGISGAIQHLAGMKDSKVIASINKDPEAPIFQVSDYGLVADLFKAVPEMNEKL
eukprot:m.602570 g.602570  ORF g.602570 m.602570 type:complete len:335 (+) comp22447_c0_seq2:150-1154(+)